MKWKVTKTVNGAYKIQPKTGEVDGRVLSVGFSQLGILDGVNIFQRLYIPDDGYHRDEWLFVNPNNNVTLEAQKMSNWCWAASARMSSKYFMLSPVSQESAAVHTKLGITVAFPTEAQKDDANYPATVGETESTLEYILASDNVYSTWGSIYSEEMLKSMLDNSGPVIIMWGWYPDGHTRDGGHFVVIYDYHWESAAGTYFYDICDPGPMNVGATYSRSYQCICNGSNNMTGFEPSSIGIWEGIVVYEEGDYLITISWPGTGV